MKKLKSVIKYAVIVLNTMAVTLTAVKFTNGSGGYLRMLIKQYYVDEVDTKKLNDGANAGMLGVLGDEHTFYIPSDYGYDTLEEEVTGEYVGIGVTISQNNGEVYVVNVFKNSPAEEAGIIGGDVVLKVEGEDVLGKSVDYVSSKVRGKAGTNVKITVKRGEKELDVTAERRHVNAQSVMGKMATDNIGYISVSSFDIDTDKEMMSEIDALGDIDGLIIDLRDNPGGIMHVAINSIDMFLDDGKILIARYKNHTETYDADEDVRYTMPVTILVNENSASASEIFSAALKENGRAKVVGVNTYGKGTIQQTFSLPSNAGANITVGRFYSPLDNEINKVGVAPDFEVTLPDELKGTATSLIPTDEDVQLKKAIETFAK